MEAIVARARQCLGARFRVHGRDPTHGLDCVGLVAFAHGIEGVAAGYALRGGSAARIATGLDAAGFGAVHETGAGDVLLLHAGTFQLHLAIAVPGGFVHADAGLRRVVETPGRPRWPLLSVWRRG